MDSLARTTL